MVFFSPARITPGAGTRGGVEKKTGVRSSAHRPPSVSPSSSGFWYATGILHHGCEVDATRLSGCSRGTILRDDADRAPGVVDRLHGILHLEAVASVRVVTQPDFAHTRQEEWKAEGEHSRGGTW